MALLKSLIQRLLDSRTTPSEASHSSYPDDGTVTQFSPSATSVSSWTKVVDSTIAPSDGYVIVRGKATGYSYVQITAGDNPPHMERSTFAKTTLNQYPILNLPIAKGKTFKVFAENTAEITVGLIKSIGGGGYNRFVRRALSCLRPSFNFSPKVFSGVKNLGSAPKLFLRKNLFLSQSQMAVLMLRLVMVGCALEIRQLLEQSCIQRWLLPRMCKEERYAMRPLEKAKLLLFSSVLKQHKPRPSLFPQSVQTNLRTGGALC